MAIPQAKPSFSDIELAALIESAQLALDEDHFGKSDRADKRAALIRAKRKLEEGLKQVTPEGK